MDQHPLPLENMHLPNSVTHVSCTHKRCNCSGNECAKQMGMGLPLMGSAMLAVASDLTTELPCNCAHIYACAHAHS